MKHLDDSSAIDVAEGRSPEEARIHAAGCPRCGDLAVGFARLLGALGHASEPLDALPQHLARWAQACARTTGQPRPRPRILELLALGAQPVAAVRGRAMTSALFGDDRHQVDLQVESSAAGVPRLHGQVVPVDETEERTWSVSVVTPGGQVRTATTDADGEFVIDDLETWNGLSLIAECGRERLVVPRLGSVRSGEDEA